MGRPSAKFYFHSSFTIHHSINPSSPFPFAQIWQFLLDLFRALAFFQPVDHLAEFGGTSSPISFPILRIMCPIARGSFSNPARQTDRKNHWKACPFGFLRISSRARAEYPGARPGFYNVDRSQIDYRIRERHEYIEALVAVKASIVIKRHALFYRFFFELWLSVTIDP